MRLFPLTRWKLCNFGYLFVTELQSLFYINAAECAPRTIMEAYA
jgi:hypothetical protein